MPDTRKLYLSSVRSVVIKLGSQLLTTRDGRLDDNFLRNIASQAVALRERGIQTTIVSSGAMGSR